MATVNKKHISELLLMEAYADLHKVKDRIRIFERKHNSNFETFEKMIGSERENFENYDDYIEWKACLAQKKDLEQKIADIKSGKVQIS